MLGNKGKQDKCDSCPNWAQILMENIDKKINTIFTLYDLVKCYEVNLVLRGA